MYADDSGKIVIGHNLASSSANGFEKDIELGKKILIEGEKFTVIGILEKKGSLIFDNMVLMTDDNLDSLVNYGDDVDVIAVKVKDKDSLDRAKEDIECAGI